MGPKPKRTKQPKFRTKIAVLDANKVRGECTCGWQGNTLVGKTSLNETIAAAQAEAATHKHKEKK